MIQELLDKKLAEIQDERKDRVRSGKISPSSLGKCFRYQYWNRKNEPVTNPPDARALRVFKVGNMLHEMIQGLVDCECEVKFETDDELGYADLVGDDWVADIKSCNSKKFWFLQKEDKIPITEREFQNFLQVGLYAVRMNKPRCGIVFVSKDDMCMAEYWVDTEAMRPHVEAELATLKEQWEKDELPEPQPRCYPSYRTNKKTGEMERVGYKEGGYCSYKDKCLEMGWDCEKGKEV